MVLINAPTHKVFHSSVPATRTVTTILTNTSVTYLGSKGLPGAYTADLVEITETYNNTFSSNTQILNQWPRYSAGIGTSNSTSVFDAPVGNYSFAMPVGVTNSISVWGDTYAWHLTHKFGIPNEDVDIWIPDVPDNIKTAYSLLLYDPAATGLSETSNVTDYKVYPNPAQNVLFVSVVLAQTEDITIQITDVTGRLIEVRKMQKSDHYLTNLNIDNFEQGLYYCIIKTSTGQAVKKFVKQ